MADEKYQITIVRYGTRATHKSGVYLNYEIYGRDDEPIGMDYFFWVLRSAERTIVVDTGFSAVGGGVRGRTTLVDPATAFQALGVRAEEAPTVIVTHAHYDHIGNLDLFPASEIVMTQTELDFWTSAYAERAQFRWSVERSELAGLAAARDEGRIRTFSGDLQVASGVTVREVGGHTPGQAIVLVDTSEGPVLLASDAAHYLEELTDDVPFAFVNDLRAMYAGFDTINALRDRGVVRHVVPGHDPQTLDLFTPVRAGVLAGNASTIGDAPIPAEGDE